MFVILHDIAQNADKVHYEMRFLPEDIRGMIRTEGETILRLAGGDQQIVVETPEEIEAAIRAARAKNDPSLAATVQELCGHVLDAWDALRSPLFGQGAFALEKAAALAKTLHPTHPKA